MINLTEVGAFASAPTRSGVDVQFGVYLPGIEPQDGYEVLVRVIHKDDRFVPQIEHPRFPLTPVAGSPNNLWHALGHHSCQAWDQFWAAWHLSVPLPTPPNDPRYRHEERGHSLVY